MPILAVSSAYPVPELLLESGDLMYCFDCRDWHDIPPGMVGTPWSAIIEQGSPMGRPCGIEEAMQCLIAGQRMSAQDFPGLIFLHVPGKGFGAIELTTLVSKPGITLHSGEWKFGPLTPEQFAAKINSRARIFVPWTPVLLG